MVELGQAAVARDGTDVTLVALASTVPLALAAAEQVGADGISAEVIDLRSLVPLDMATVLASVQRTSRLIIVEENPYQGGWGGTVCGLSSLDFKDASENESTTFRDFKNGQWYKVRLRVLEKRITAWIDDKQVVDLATKNKKLSIRAECEPCKPFGVATWRTVGAVRDIRVRGLTEAEKEGTEKKK